MRPAWEQHVAPFNAVAELADISAQIHDSAARAEGLVKIARGGSLTWEQIGAAVPLMRRGAQRRWGHLNESD